MSQTSKKLRKARPCYTCGFIDRHFRHSEDPCVCLACKRMPQEWRDELAAEYLGHQKDREYNNFFAVKYGRQLDYSAIKPVELPSYAWPGGYQMIYFIDGDAVCPKCIMEVLRETYMTGREQISRDIFCEGPSEICSECGEKIKSAYGDPNAK